MDCANGEAGAIGDYSFKPLSDEGLTNEIPTCRFRFIRHLCAYNTTVVFITSLGCFPLWNVNYMSTP